LKGAERWRLHQEGVEVLSSQGMLTGGGWRVQVLGGREGRYGLATEDRRAGGLSYGAVKNGLLYGS